MTRTFVGCGLAAALALVAGCGGGDGGVAEPAAGAAAASAVDPLFGDDGEPSVLARQRPAGAAPVTRSGLYATPRQLAWTELISQPYTVVVDVDRHASPDEAVEHTLRNLRTSGQAGRDAAFFVHAADPARAAWVADELAASGAPRVFVVVHEGAW